MNTLLQSVFDLLVHGIGFDSLEFLIILTIKHPGLLHRLKLVIQLMDILVLLRMILIWRQCILLGHYFLAVGLLDYDGVPNGRGGRAGCRLGWWRITLDMYVFVVVFIALFSINILINRIKNLIEFYRYPICHVRRIRWIFLQFYKLVKWMIYQFEHLILRFCQNCDVCKKFLINWRLPHISIIKLPHKQLYVAAAKFRGIEAVESQCPFIYLRFINLFRQIHYLFLIDQQIFLLIEIP